MKVASIVLAILISDLFFIGGAGYLCVKYNWSLWTIFWGSIIACECSTFYLKILRLNNNG